MDDSDDFWDWVAAYEREIVEKGWDHTPLQPKTDSDGKDLTDG